MESNLFKQIDVAEHYNRPKQDVDDIDNILKELQDKNKKKQNKFPMISTKQKFFKGQKKEHLR